MRSRLGRRTVGLAHAAAHDGHGQNGLHVVQPGSRRSCQRSDCQRDRCIGRSDGPHHRPNDRPVPDAQSFERRRDVESPGRNATKPASRRSGGIRWKTPETSISGRMRRPNCCSTTPCARIPHDRTPRAQKRTRTGTTSGPPRKRTVSRGSGPAWASNSPAAPSCSPRELSSED